MADASPILEGEHLVFFAARVSAAGPDHVAVRLGNSTVTLRREDVVAAGRSYLAIQSEDGALSAYDVQLNTVAMFGGDEEFAE